MVDEGPESVNNSVRVDFEFLVHAFDRLVGNFAVNFGLQCLEIALDPCE